LPGERIREQHRLPLGKREQAARQVGIAGSERVLDGGFVVARCEPAELVGRDRALVALAGKQGRRLPAERQHGRGRRDQRGGNQQRCRLASGA
jgi:hypothetical protein